MRARAKSPRIFRALIPRFLEGLGPDPKKYVPIEAAEFVRLLYVGCRSHVHLFRLSAFLCASLLPNLALGDQPPALECPRIPQVDTIASGHFGHPPHLPTLRPDGTNR